MRKGARPSPNNRDGIWYLVRRVPVKFAGLDKRRIVRISADIAVAHDPKGFRAQIVVDHLDRELWAYWRGMVDGQSAEARRRFDAATRRARALNLAYQTADELAAGPIDAILERLKLLTVAWQSKTRLRSLRFWAASGDPSCAFPNS